VRPVTPRFASEEEVDEEPVVVPVVRREVVIKEPDFEPAHEVAVVAATENACIQTEAAVAVAEAAAPEPTLFTPHEEEHGENLDIPAFMRRGGL
jgi:cell division protein FtsZ